MNLKDLFDNKENWKLIPKVSGIYAIHNKITDGVYVGSSAAKKGGIRARLQHHFRDLVSNIHCNNYLQNAFNKYGIESFSFHIIEICKPEDCLKYEQSWLDFKFGNNCYNLSPTAGNNYGCKRRDAKQYKVTLPTGDTLITSHLATFAKEHNLNLDSCRDVARYELSHVKGYIFKFLDKELDNKYKNKNKPRGIKIPKLAKIFCADGRVIIIRKNGLAEFQYKELNNKNDLLSRVCYGNSRGYSYKNYEGYYCDENGVILPEVALNRIKQDAITYKNLCYKRLNQPLIKFENIKTGEIIYSKQYSTTCELLDISDSNVADCIAGRKTNVKGWKINKVE